LTDQPSAHRHPGPSPTVPGARGRATVPTTPVTTARGYRGKRVVDLVMLLVLAPPALVIVAIAAIAILVTDGRPVLFRQRRTGRDGVPFTILKLRTMTVGASALSPFPDPTQVTRVGRILRRLSIDELPQLINIATADMSFVGPRPTLPYQVERYRSEHRARLDILPGITGLAQVHGRNQLTWDERIALDLEYSRTQSMRLDLEIMARSVFVALLGIGVEGHPMTDPIAAKANPQ
jgi:sugar transferase EpsL